MTGAPVPGRLRLLDLQGSRRAVLEWGEPGAPIVLLQHGMRDHAHSWDWVGAHLSDRYHVVAPDMRGHGDSDWAGNGNYGLNTYVLDLAQIVDTLTTAPIKMIGHSLGGHMVLRYAASFPERVESQLLIECIELPLVREERAEPTPFPQRVRKWIESEGKRRTLSQRYYPDVAAAQERMAAANPLIDAPTIAHLTHHGLIEDPVKGHHWKYDPACRLRAPEDQSGAGLDQILEAVTCPTLLAYGDDSWIPHPPAERLARLRQHRLVRFADASHWLHHQRRESFCALVDTFLADPVGTINNERLIHA